MTTPPTPQPGWYADPAVPNQLRWFDGSRWTQHIRPKPAGPSVPTPSGPGTWPGQPHVASIEGGTARRSWFARHKFLTGLGAVVAFLVVAGIAGGSGDDSAPSAGDVPSVGATAEAEASTEEKSGEDDAEESAGKDAEKTTDKKQSEDRDSTDAKTPGLGDKVRDGKFEFTVTKVEKGIEEVGDQYLNQEAQGQFVLVHLTVKNIGDRAQTFYDSNQNLTDTKGRTFEADSTAGIYLDQANLWLEEINPGNSVKGVIVFDVPTSAKLSSIDLHDSMFSGGVTVSLT